VLGIVDTVSPEQRSEIMRRIRSKDTRPEMIVRHLIHGMGYRYRLHKLLIDLTSKGSRSGAYSQRHLRGRSGFIDKDQTMGLKAHARLAQPDPLIALPGDVGTALLAGQQRFF
jgi:hypothetical protein